MKQPLLTIGIPTYNREKYLDRCLDSIISQLSEVNQVIELVVSNNASTDRTKDIVGNQKSINHLAHYENKVNLGPDSTCLMCFDKANGKYVWILGDDEFLLKGSLKQIVDLLTNKDYGDVYLQCIPYHQENELVDNPITFTQTITYQDPLEFIKKIHYYVTFISGNIINKSILPIDYNYQKYIGTNIVQVGWTIKAIYAAKENLFVETPLIAAKQNNSGGYQFVNTFAKNYNFILKDLVKNGYDKNIVNITNSNLIKDYFPANIIKLLYFENRFDTENHYAVLHRTFWKYKSFWVKLFPIYAKYWTKKLLGKKIEKFS